MGRKFRTFLLSSLVLSAQGQKMSFSAPDENNSTHPKLTKNDSLTKFWWRLWWEFLSSCNISNYKRDFNIEKQLPRWIMKYTKSLSYPPSMQLIYLTLLVIQESQPIMIKRLSSNMVKFLHGESFSIVKSLLSLYSVFQIRIAEVKT